MPFVPPTSPMRTAVITAILVAVVGACTALSNEDFVKNNDTLAPIVYYVGGLASSVLVVLFGKKSTTLAVLFTLSLAVAGGSTASAAHPLPWHLQPMDTWLPGECYRSPSIQGAGTSTQVDLTDYRRAEAKRIGDNEARWAALKPTKPCRFKVGDTVSTNRYGVCKIESVFYDGESQWRLRSKDSSGETWDLWERDCKGASEAHAVLGDNYRRNFELDDPEHDAWYAAKQEAAAKAAKVAVDPPYAKSVVDLQNAIHDLEQRIAKLEELLQVLAKKSGNNFAVVDVVSVAGADDIAADFKLPLAPNKPPKVVAVSASKSLASPQASACGPGGCRSAARGGKVRSVIGKIFGK